MKIVVLDGYTLNPGDLSWESLEALGDTTIYQRSTDDEVLERSRGADVILTNKAPITREIIENLPGLRFIGVLATGYNIVDIEAARERGIPVTNVPTYGTTSVAQMVFAHVLNLAQHVAHHAETVRQGRWSASQDWSYWDCPLIELAGLTMGVLGYGRIGRTTGDLARAFGMQVIAYDPFVDAAHVNGTRMVDIDTLFRESDVISLHTPLTPETEGLVNARYLAMMKPTALLINTSRGQVVNEGDLAAALNEGRIAGAGLDVLSEEPPDPDNPLLTARNCYVTPHISWATRSARARLLEIVVENIAAFQRGEPQNVVNP
jgi:glycerate dehydrogenase